MKFDYIIIGGGSAGCAVAARLAEKSQNKVVLIEAGGSNLSPFIQIPLFTMATLPLNIKNWHFKTTKKPHLNNRRGYQPRGKVLGGSSGINAMIYIRGQPQDYDTWASTTHQRWSYQQLLPVFKSFENNENIHDEYHGQGGKLNVKFLETPNPASQAFIEAGVACGYPHNNDFNGSTQEGIGLFQVTQKAGRRHSAADAYLGTLPENLTVLTKTRALKLLLDDMHCYGVTVKQSGKIFDIKANCEVILSCGAFGSPQLLMISGIGPTEELARHDITVKHELEGVGQNLHDHPDYILSYTSKHRATLGMTPGGIWDVIRSIGQYRSQKTGVIATNFAEAGAFLKSDPAIDTPDLQLHFVPAIIDQHMHKIHLKRGISCHVCLLKPQSRGRLHLRSSNPFDKPRIDLQLMTHPQDWQTMLKGIEMTREIMSAKPLQPFIHKELYIKRADHQELIQLIKQRVDTIYHPVGSCKMGNDASSVVDPTLSVRGMTGLRIADASIMPEVISGNMNAPSILIGEMAARLILENISAE